MPWHIEMHDSCPASEPHAVINNATGDVVPGGCHATEAEAKKHMAALYANEPEARAAMSAASINDLPDSAFAYIEPGGKKDASGRTVPRLKRHFPIHDAAHVRNALARAPQSPFGAKAMPKIRAAAKKFGIEISGAGRSLEGTPMAELERRYTSVAVEYRTEGDRKKIGGYAAKFNVTSRNLGGFVEVIMPAAFNRTRGDGWPDVVARYNHDNNMLLGTTGSGTLSLRTDETGLFYEVEPPQSRSDIVELVARGDVRRSSFAFRTVSGDSDDWALNDVGFPQRTLLDVQLVDVAPCNAAIAAYPDATVGLRSLAYKMNADLEEVRTLAEEGELRKFFVRTDQAGKPATVKMFGPAAAAALLARRTDPWA